MMMYPFRTKQKPCRADGFTLIELLCVVVILGLLSAMALANFSEARSRAVCARVKAEHRTLAGCLEMYRLDMGRYPKGSWHVFTDKYYLPHDLTTPIAYISSLPIDPYPEPRTPIGASYKYFEWQEDTPVQAQKRGWFGFWMMASSGPDQKWDQAGTPYDPTNGVFSKGDLVWRQSEHLRRN